MLHEFIKYSLGPVLYVQGKYLRVTVPNIPEPDGDREGSRGTGESLRMFIAGDSSAAGVGAPHQDAALSGQLLVNMCPQREVTWKLIAKNAWTTEDMLQRLSPEPSGEFDVAVTSLGANDALCGYTVKRHMSNQKRLVDVMRNKFKVKKCYLTAVPPLQDFPLLPRPLNWFLGRTARLYNEALVPWIDSDEDLEFVPLGFPLTPDMLAPDMFHPGPPTYKAWGEMLAARLLADVALSKSQSQS